MRKEDVIDLHFGFFRDFGFSFHPQHLLFEKPFTDGKQVIFVHYTEYPEVSYLEYKLGIRNDLVETIIHKFLPTLSDYAQRSITLIQSPDAIQPGFPKKFVLDQNFDLNEAMELGEEFMVKHGLHWLDQLSDVKSLEAAFECRKSRPFPNQNFVYHAFRGITLARLYHKKGYEELRQVYLEQIKENELTPFTIASFLQLLDFLDHL